MTKKKMLAHVAVASAAAVMLTQGVAHADTNPGNTTTLVAVGSDTSQDVMEALSGIIKDASGNPLISNYEATPVGRTITTRSGNPHCTFTTPRNSVEGRDALSATIGATSFAGGGTTTPVTSSDMTGCVDIARSATSGNPTVSPGVGKLTYIPFATDSVTFATRDLSSLPHKLNIHTLKTLYTSNGTAGTRTCLNAAPLLPAFGSGTRGSFANLLGIPDAVIGTAGSWGTCVSDTDAADTPIQEHDGRFLTAADQLIPFATAQFIAQQTGVIPDTRGSASLGAIDFGASGTANAVSPVDLETNFGTGTRSLYNVVSTYALTDPRITAALVGASSQVCRAVSTIHQYGLAVNPACGSTGRKNTN